MRIGIDGWAVAPEGKGHARTARRTVESLAALESGHELVAFVRSVAAAELLPRDVERVVVRDRVALTWEQVGLPRAVRRHRLDVVLTLTDRLPLVGGGRYVVWLFELPTHRIAENRRRGAGLYQRGSDLLTLALWRRSLRRAVRVVAGSRATARELGLDVPVVYPGLDERFAPGAGEDGRYLLHLASDDPRDNTAAVLDAYARVRERVPVLLVVAGALSAPPARAGVEYRGRVPDDELIRLYRGASAYVDATLYEGFGYQPLEAMACGAPVVASNRSSIPEVVGDAGLLAEPEPDALAAAVLRVLEEPGLAEELRGRGLERARTFTWERTARELLAVLEDAAL